MRRLNRILLTAAATSVLLSAGMAQAASNLLTDGSFENYNIGTGNYTYPGVFGGTIAQIGATPTAPNPGWTYNGAALVNASGGSAWYGGAGPTGKDGVQFAALQNNSTITQSFTAGASTENLGWLSAGRACCSAMNQSYDVSVLQGASTVFTSSAFTSVAGSNFSFNSLAVTGLSAGQNYTLSFNGLTNTADQTAFLDNVILQNAAFPAPPAPVVITPLHSLNFNTDPGVPLDEQLIDDFTNPATHGFHFSGGYTRPGLLGLDPGISAPPPGDLTDYETVLGGESATLTAPGLMKSFSFYLGSPDAYNSVELIGPGFDQLLKGDEIWGNNIQYFGNQGVGLRVRYDFGANPVDKIIFSSSGNSFEFDSLAANIGVPEPETWALMILGFGGVGALLRNRGRQALAAV